jgi:hypothetical protein
VLRSWPSQRVSSSGEEREALDGEGDVREVGDGAMAVLEVEGVEELLGLLRADLDEGFAQGESRARVLGHGVGEDLGLGAVDGVDFGGAFGGLGSGLWVGLGRFAFRHDSKQDIVPG